MIKYASAVCRSEFRRLDLRVGEIVSAERILGAYAGGLLFDRTGSYVLVFSVAGALAGLASVSVLTIPSTPTSQETRMMGVIPLTPGRPPS